MKVVLPLKQQEKNFVQLVDFQTRILAHPGFSSEKSDRKYDYLDRDHSIILVETIFNSRFISNKEMILDWSNKSKGGLFNYLKDVQWSTE